METETNFFAASKIALEKYIEDRILLLKLQSSAKIAELTSLMFIGFLFMNISFFIVLFLGIMAGYYFASLTGSLYWGFGIVAGIYTLMLIALILFGKNVLGKAISNLVIKILLDQKNKDDDKINTK